MNFGLTDGSTMRRDSLARWQSETSQVRSIRGGEDDEEKEVEEIGEEGKEGVGEKWILGGFLCHLLARKLIGPNRGWLFHHPVRALWPTCT